MNTQDKLNQLLEQSTNALLCGPECQRIKKEEELKQAYDNAKSNLYSAPAQVEDTKRKYYEFSKGSAFYDQMQETELEKKAAKLADKLKSTFNQAWNQAEVVCLHFKTSAINSKYTNELLNDYVSENITAKKTLYDTRTDIITNDRKTYYEEDALTRLRFWYAVYWYFYYLLVIIVTISLVTTKGIASSIGWLIALWCYPYFIGWVWIVLRKLTTIMVKVWRGW